MTVQQINQMAYEKYAQKRKNRYSNFLLGFMMLMALVLTGTFYASKNGAEANSLIHNARGTTVVSNQYHE